MKRKLPSLVALLNAQPTRDALPTSGVQKPAEKPRLEEPIDGAAVLPEAVGSHPLQYAYAFGYELLEDAELPQPLLQNTSSSVDVDEEAERILLRYQGEAFAYIENPYKAQMLRDFKAQSLPVVAVLQPGAELVHVGFYKDPSVGHAWREQSVARLLTYNNPGAQEGLRLAIEGAALYLNEDPELSFVPIYYKEFRIGSLPLNYSRRYHYQGAAFVALDHLETEKTAAGALLVPFVRIYWQNTPTHL